MDASLYQEINRLAVHTAWAHAIMKAYAVYGPGLFGVLVLAGWWFARLGPDAPRAVAASVWAAVGTVVALGVNQPIVAAVHRARSFVTMPGAEVLVTRSHDLSFPSDHAVTVAAATAGLLLVTHYGGRAIRRLAITSIILAVFLAFARVYVGSHYPGDVAAGLLTGAAITTLGWLALSRLLTRLAILATHHHSLRPLITVHVPERARETFGRSIGWSDNR